MLKRLSRKIRKMQSYVRSRSSKNVPKSSTVHDLIKNNANIKKVHIKQESGLYKKCEGDMSTIQVEINMERNISNTEGSFCVISRKVSTRV